MRRVVLACFLLVACSSTDDETEAATTTTTPTTAPEYEPAFAEAPCEEEVPEDPRYECGALTVPADRDAPADGDVVLPVMILRSADPAARPDPVVHITGGPGFAANVWTQFFLEREFGGNRDVILMDQRGTGGADPSLDCPEQIEVAVQNGVAGDPAVEDARFEAAMTACRDRLVADGVDLTDYDTPATAADFADLRVALGLDEWNVWGHSYGTAVTQELLRSHPEGIRSVVIDSVLPLDVGIGPHENTRLADEAFRRVFDGCAADAACAAAFPDQEADFRALVAEWDAEPFPVRAFGPDRVEHDFAITGRDVVEGAWQALYDAALLPVLPSLTNQLRERGDGASAIVRPLLEQSFIQVLDLSEAQQRSVDCADRGRFVLDAGPVETDDPILAPFALGDETACARWGVEPLPASFNELATWEAPTLVLVGEYDPVTPVRYSQDVAANLPNETLVVLPGLAHGPVFGSECAEDLLHAFVDAAGPNFDQTCVDELGPPAWAV